VEAAVSDPLRRKTPFEIGDRCHRASDHGPPRLVDRGQREIGAEEREDRRLGEVDREHSARRHLLHEPAAQGDEAETVLEGEDTGQAGGDVFADAVPQQGGGRDPLVDPELGERIFEGEERRLCEGRLDERSR
jgi:hypothetical protein